MQISNIFTHTPFWVWILLLFLILRGIKALSDREMTIQRLFLLPIIFLLWGGYGVIEEVDLPGFAILSMVVGLLLGAVVGWMMWCNTARLRQKTGTDLIIRPGSPLTLITILISFVIKFILVAILSINPDLRSSLDFNILFGLISGVIDGIFWGGTINLYLTSPINIDNIR